MEPNTMRRANSSSEKQRRRLDLLVAAKSCFAASGFHRTTMGDVARAAGVSHGTVYVYFLQGRAVRRSRRGRG
ncbi:MAG: helix-turn-helix domain-containing protein [Microthrixaceae bacterium]